VRNTEGLSRAFGFVELATEADRSLALELNGYQWNGRQLVVEETKEK
jgi:RNA recognition motif-containing protein